MEICHCRDAPGEVAAICRCPDATAFLRARSVSEMGLSTRWMERDMLSYGVEVV